MPMNREMAKACEQIKTLITAADLDNFTALSFTALADCKYLSHDIIKKEILDNNEYLCKLFMNMGIGDKDKMAHYLIRLFYLRENSFI